MSKELSVSNLDASIALINDTIAWAEKYHPTSFQFEDFKKRRRQLKKIRYAMLENCSAAAYGESQVGKSYLMSSLLSTSSSQFQVSDGKGGLYSFVDALNPSGGNNSKEESTGVITRFTTRCTNEKMRSFVHIRSLSIVDIILMLADTYFKDVKSESLMDKEDVNERVDSLLKTMVDQNYSQHFIDEDDIYEINEYLQSVIGALTSNITRSYFCTKIAPVIKHIRVESWGEVFSILWNKNDALTAIFRSIINEFEKLRFEEDLYVPFDAVLRDKGTLLKVNWLDVVCGDSSAVVDNAVMTTEVYDSEGRELAKNFGKAYLSTITAELTFLVPESVAQEKPFLNNMDLLDFPGARRRENVHEENIDKELKNMLRRGKVAYLFNKYSRALRINSVLFCQHADMSGQSEIGEYLNEWICNNIGSTPKERANFITATGKVSPFFIVSTKFNIDLKYTKENENSPLSDRWKTRFVQTLSTEIIKPNTYSWFNDYVDESFGFGSSKFQNIYMLRDFFWSRDQQIFEGFIENVSPERSEIVPPSYPQFRQDLKASFVDFPFVKDHFEDPDRAWNESATLNNDGSLAIISKLSKIAPYIDNARKKKYQSELDEVMRYVSARLADFYVPNDENEKRQRTRKTIGGIRLSLDMIFGAKQPLLGRMMDRLMISSVTLRKVAYDIIIMHKEKPIDHGMINNLRMNAGITSSDSRDVCLQKLCDYYGCDEELLRDLMEEQNVNLDDLISGEEDLLTTVPAVLAKKIFDVWIDHVHQSFQEFESDIKHTDQLVNMYGVLYERLGIGKVILSIIEEYEKKYPKEMLPTVISDAVSLVLNQYITNVGRDRMTPQQMSALKQTSDMLGIRIDSTAPSVSNAKGDLIDTLRAFVESTQLVGKPILSPEEKNTLHKLPWWNNYSAWKENIVKGLLLVSDVTYCNEEENNSLKKILDQINIA